MNCDFTWIPFYKELSDWLLGKQNSQPELISTLKEIGIPVFVMVQKEAKRLFWKRSTHLHSFRISTSFTPMKEE